MKHLHIAFVCCLLSFFVVSGRETYEYSLKGIQKRHLQVVDLCQYDESKPYSVNCQIETGSFLPSSTSNSTNTTDWKNLRIVEYNIDRNGRGGDGPNEDGLDPIVEALRQFQPIDILLLSEVSRDCPQWDSVNGAQYIAEKLQMEWAYAVEYVELNEELMDNNYQCTIGNAVLSSRPLSNIVQKVFKSQCCNFGGRAGGRVAIKATVQEFGVTFISSHLESGTGFSDFVEAMVVRNKQSNELVGMIDPQEASNNLIVIGGDFNSPFRQFSLGEAFKCFMDPLDKKYPWPTRNTCVGDELGVFGLSAFDYVYLKNHQQYSVDPEICKTMKCYGFSDHYPLKFDISRI